MANDNVSIDEFLSSRKAHVSGDMLVKAATGAQSWNEAERSVRFVMSAEVEDRDKDIVFQSGLATDKFLENPIAPFAHRSSDFPVGSWSEVEQKLTGRPPRTEGKLTLVPAGKDQQADRLAFHISAGTIKACSIGFIPKLVERRPNPPGTPSDTYRYNGYHIREAELIECSPCTIPSNPAALAKSAAGGDVMAREMIEEILDNWVKNPASGLLEPREDFEAAYRAAAGDKTIIVLGGKSFTIEPIVPVIQAPEADPETKTLLGRIEALLTRAFPPAQSADEIRREVEASAQAKAQADTSEIRSLELELAVLEGRVGTKTAA